MAQLATSAVYYVIRKIRKAEKPDQRTLTYRKDTHNQSKQKELKPLSYVAANKSYFQRTDTPSDRLSSFAT